MSPRYFIAMLLSITALPCGCSRKQPLPTTASPAEAVVTHPLTESFPHIRAVAPDAVPFSDNKAILRSFHVAYEIESPELLTNARLELRTDRSLIARVDVPIQSHGEFDLHVDNDVTIGPTIRFQLQCPSGETNWLAIGALRPPTSSAQPRIEDITPDHIPEESDLDASSGGADAPVEFYLWGAGFERDCKARFTVNNGQPLDAPARFWTAQKVYVTITRRPLSRMDWSNQRYLDLRLVTERRASDWTPKHHSYLDSKADIRAIPVLDQ